MGRRREEEERGRQLRWLCSVNGDRGATDGRVEGWMEEWMDGHECASSKKNKH